MPTTTVGILRVLLAANTAEFESELKKAEGSLKGFTREVGAIGRSAQTLGQGLTAALTVPIVAVGAGAIKAASDFESSFAGVRKTVKATEPEFKAMAQAFRGLATQIPVNVNELNRLGEAAGAMDIPRAAIVDFTKTMALLGVTTNVTSEQAAESIGKIQNIFGAAGKDTERFASTLVALGNEGASTEQEILSMATRIAGAGKVIGLTQGQVLAFGSALASVGLEAEAGGTAISRTFLTINDAVMSGGASLAEFARVAGMSTEAFKTAFQTDAAGATTAFISGLARIQAEGENVNQVLGKLELGEIRVRDTLLRASGAGDVLTKALNLQGKAWQENTALTKEAGERFKTLESQLKLFWAQLRDVGITLGTSLLPTLRELLDVATPVVKVIAALVEGFGKLPKPVRDVGLATAATVALMGPALIIFGKMATAIAELAAPAAIAGTAKVATGISGIGTAAVIATPLVAKLALTIGGLYAGAKILEQLLALLDERQKRNAATVSEQERRYAMMGQATDIAGRTIHTYDEAVQIVTEHVRKLNAGVLEGALVYDRAAGPTRDLTAEHKTLVDQLAAARKAVANLSEEQRANIRAGHALKLSVKEIAADLQIAEPIVQAYLDSLKKTGKTAEEIAEGPFKKLRNRIIELNAQLLAAKGEGVGAYQLALEELGSELEETGRRAKMLGTDLPAELALAVKIVTNRAAAQKEIERLRDSFQFYLENRPVQLRIKPVLEGGIVPGQDAVFGDVTRFLEPLKAAISGPFQKEIKDQFGNVIRSTVSQPGLFAGLGKNLADTFKTSFGPTIMAAITGGGSITKAIGGLFGQSLTQSLTANLTTSFPKFFSGFLGQTLGSIIPGVGALLGPALSGLFGKLFGGVSAEVKKAREELQGFQAELGKTATAQQKAEAGGRQWALDVIVVRDAFRAVGRSAQEAEALVRQLWDTDHPERAKAAMQEINQVLEEQRRRLEENTKEASGLFDELMAFGSENGVSGAMREVIERLITTGLLTADQISKLRGLADSTTVDFKKMQAAVEVFKGRVDTLGPAFQQARIDETAKKYVNALDVMTRGGADVGGVLFDAREELSELVRDAIKNKSVLPENLRPFVEELLRSGNLLDENGEALTDLSQLRWGAAIKTEAQLASEAWDKILAKVDEFLEKLGKIAGFEIPTPRVREGGPVLPQPGPEGPEGWVTMQSGTLGRFGSIFHDFGTGMRAMLHGNEAVLTPAQLAKVIEDVTLPTLEVPTLPGPGEWHVPRTPFEPDLSRVRSGEGELLLKVDQLWRTMRDFTDRLPLVLRDAVNGVV